MLHQHLNSVERRLIAREGSREWDFTHGRDFRWLILLGVLVSVITLYFTFDAWLSNVRLLP